MPQGAAGASITTPRDAYLEYLVGHGHDPIAMAELPESDLRVR